jgi:molybdopterin molybdotransferase
MSDPSPRPAAVDSILSLRRRRLEATPTTSTTPAAVSGRVLADRIEAPRDDPATDRSTMDGYAVATGDGSPWVVTRREVYPEDEQPEMGEGEAVPVATGGRLPERADAVLKREDTELDGEELRGPAVDPGTNVYARGSNLAAGETLFERGERLLPKDAVLLDDIGGEELLVRRRWSVGVLATGSELAAGDAPDRDSNMLVGLARSLGHDATHEGAVADDPTTLRERLASLARKHDVVVTSGGTSVGSRDHVGDVLADLGDVLVDGTRTRPGQSVSVARLQDAVAVSLPGRPVACHLGAALYVRPLLTGRRDLPGVAATAEVAIDLGPDGECAVPVRLDRGDDEGGAGGSARPGEGACGSWREGGRCLARPIDADPDAERYTFRPSLLSSMTRATRADGFLLLSENVAAGEAVTVAPFAGVERS